MRQAIRALGWATYILWLILTVFTATAVYSAFQLIVDFDDPQQPSVSGATITLLLPFSIENNGFYEISDLNIITIVQESNGALVSNSSTAVPPISSGKKVNAAHNISIALDKMTSDSLSRLLFYDADLDVDMSFALRYAGVFPLKISTNFTTPWGAPLSNLTIGNPYSTDSEIVVPISFENNSLFNLTGTMRLELVNNMNQQVGAGITPINVVSNTPYNNNVEVTVSGPINLRETRLYLYFFTSVFSYGPVVIPIA